MPSRAYHTLLLPDGTTRRMMVVTTDDDGRFVSCHHMTGEEPFVEWVGGTFDARCLPLSVFADTQ